MMTTRRERIRARFGIPGGAGVTVTESGDPELKDLDDRAETIADVLGGLAGVDEALKILEDEE